MVLEIKGASVPAELFSPDGSAAASIGSLALMLGVHRNRISEWRKAGAPDSLQLESWRQWLRSSRRGIFAHRLTSALPADQIPTSPAVSLMVTPAADDVANGAVGSEADADEAQRWETRASRAKALRAELALESERAASALAARELITAAEARSVILRLSGAVNDVIGRGIWRDLLIALPGVPDTAVAYLRQQHASAILSMRSRVADAARDCLRTLTPPTKESHA